MCQLYIQPHLFSPLDSKKVDIEHGQTIGQLLGSLTPRYQSGQDQPLIVRVNGKLVDSVHWDNYTILETHTIVISPRPFGFDPVSWVYAVVAVIGAAYSYTQMRKMKGMQSDYRELPEQSPTYDTNAQGNSARLGQPIPIAYGNHVTWPDFAAQPYRRYEDGKQYLYSLFSIGQGEYELSNKKIGNTAFDSFEGIEEQLCGPGEQVDLFSPDVLTSDEVSNIDLYAANDENYAGWSGPYVVCPVGVECKRIELDFLLSGLYDQDDNGDLIDATVSFDVEYRPIDNEDESIGEWMSLFSREVTDNTVDMLRYTFGQDVPLGRYEVRAQRSNLVDLDSTRVRDDLIWGELKAVIQSDAIYDHTVWAVKALVTGQLSNLSERKFNCMAQRLLDVWDGSKWVRDQSTRNPAWAFCDMVMAKYAGGYSDEYLDLETIKTLADTWEIRGDYFDYRFDTKGTLDAALQLICRAGRAVKVEYDGAYSIVRDSPKLVPDYQFGMTEIIDGSMNVQYLTQDQWADDSVEVSYVDNETGQTNTIICALPGKTSEQPRALKLEGVTDRTHAYREGMFEAARAEYRNRVVTYKTELAGGLVDYGSCVSLSHVMSDWGTSGEVHNTEIDGNLLVLTLSEPVSFKEGEEHVIQLADIRNRPQGPYIATAGENSNQVIISSTHMPEIYTGFKRKRTGFQFGIAQHQNMRFIINSISPDGDYQFTQSGEYDNPIVHSFDDLIDDGTIPLPEPSTVFNSELDRVAGLRIAFTGSYSTPVINVTWSPVSNAERYVLQISRDSGGTWSTYVSTSDLWYRAAFDKSINYLRIAAMSDLVGPWTEKEISLSVDDQDRLRPNTPTGLKLTEPFIGLSCKIQWDEQLDAKRWRISVCNTAGEAKRTIGVTNPEYSYTAENAKADGLGRHLLFKVWAESDEGDHSFDYAELSASNPQIGALNNINGSDFIDHAQISTSIPNASDFEGFIVWMSPSSNFTPTDSLIVSKGSRGPVISFPIPEEKMYAKIAAYDAWGTDDLTISSEITFTRPLIDNSRLAQDLREKIDISTGNATLIQELTDEVGSQILLKAAGKNEDGDYLMAGVAIGTEEISRVLFYADKFGFMHPDAGSALVLAVENGKTTIANASIGTASITSANIASLAANKIDATSLSAITADLGAITAGSLASRDGVSFWNLDTGSAAFSNATFSGNINASTINGGTINGADGNFSGTLTANAINAVDTINIRGQAVSTTVLWTPSDLYTTTSSGTSQSLNISTEGYSGVLTITGVLSTRGNNTGDELEINGNGVLSITIGGVLVLKKTLLGGGGIESTDIAASGIIPTGAGNRQLVLKITNTSGQYTELKGITAYMISAKR